MAGISSLRPGARRDAQQVVDERDETERRKQAEAEAARAAARAAINAARDAGAPQPQWSALLARATDQTALEVAELADARDHEIREHAARELDAALAERERRADLSPVAAAEHRIRTAHAPRPAADEPSRPPSSKPPPKPRPSDTGSTTMALPNHPSIVNAASRPPQHLPTRTTPRSCHTATTAQREALPPPSTSNAPWRT